jgi:hypothetical protein
MSERDENISLNTGVVRVSTKDTIIFIIQPNIKLVSALILVVAVLSFGLGGSASASLSLSAAGSWWAGLASASVALFAICSFNKALLPTHAILSLLALGCCIGGAVVDGSYSRWFRTFKACTINTSSDPYQYSTWDQGTPNDRARTISANVAALNKGDLDRCYCVHDDLRVYSVVPVPSGSCFMITKYVAGILEASCAIAAVCGLLMLVLCCMEVRALYLISKKKRFGFGSSHSGHRIVHDIIPNGGEVSI